MEQLQILHSMVKLEFQNRNPGYSDFTTSNGTASFSFSNASTNPISHGANALKLENEVISENIGNETVDDINNQYHEELLRNQEAENIVHDTSNENEQSFSQEAIKSLETDEAPSNDLKEFRY